MVGGPALGDRPVEETVGQRRDQQVRHAERPSRLAADGHPVRVPAELRDVVTYPPEGRHLIEGAVDPRRGKPVSEV